MPDKKQFRWELSDMSPGASLVARVAFPPVSEHADIAQGSKACILQAFNVATTGVSALPDWELEGNLSSYVST